MGREFFESVTLPIFNDYNISTEDKLATFVEHIAIQTGEAAKGCDKGKMLISGGGAKTHFSLNESKRTPGMKSSFLLKTSSITKKHWYLLFSVY